MRYEADFHQFDALYLLDEFLVGLLLRSDFISVRGA